LSKSKGEEASVKTIQGGILRSEKPFLCFLTIFPEPNVMLLLGPDPTGLAGQRRKFKK
jgi:hypothetical protein